MKKIKKALSLLLSAVTVFLMGTVMTACNGGKTETATVRYLNFKPESASIYEELARAYEEETGVKVVV